MTDLNKLRSEFESDLADHLIERDITGTYFNDEIQNDWEKHLLKVQVKELKAELEKAKAQAVPEGYVLIKKEDIENWYLDESEYMWFEADGIDGYLEDIDIGEVVEVQRKEYVVTNSNPVFAAKPWDDNGNYADTWEFFESKDEAEKAAAHCKAMVEASGSGAER